MCDGKKESGDKNYKRGYSETDAGEQARSTPEYDDQNEREHKNERLRPSHLKTGWVIEGKRIEDGQPTGRFLQIGTGQWCPQQYATVFPLRKTAIVYAHEFGYSVGHNASVVRYDGV